MLDPVMTEAEREYVLAEFPELGDSSFLDPDDASCTADDHIEGWVRYWREMAKIIRRA